MVTMFLEGVALLKAEACNCHDRICIHTEPRPCRNAWCLLEESSWTTLFLSRRRGYKCQWSLVIVVAGKDSY